MFCNFTLKSLANKSPLAAPECVQFVPPFATIRKQKFCEKFRVNSRVSPNILDTFEQTNCRSFSNKIIAFFVQSFNNLRNNRKLRRATTLIKLQ